MSEERVNRVRASDAEREQVAAALREAMSEGRLTLAEGEERLAQVYATTYRDELPPLTADLPPHRPEQSGRQQSGQQQSGQQQERGRRWDGRRRRVIGLAAAGAVAAGVWAVAGGGPVWLAILLGVLTMVMVKHAVFGYFCQEQRPEHRGHHGYHGPLRTAGHA